MSKLTNPLFLALVAAGVVLIIGVLLYNWLQERQVRKRIEGSFRKPSDVGLTDERIEPIFNPVQPAATASVVVDPLAVDAAADDADDEPLPADAVPVAVPTMRGERTDNAPDSEIECVATLRPKAPARTAELSAAMSVKLAKPVRWLGRKSPGLPWLSIEAGSTGPWTEIAACFLLANRGGAASRTDVEQFVRAAKQAASATGASVDIPDAAESAARAEELDAFCADLDVQIGLTVLKGELGQIAGTRLRGVAEASGFRLNAAGHFDFVQEETGKSLYSLQNFKQEPFTIEGLRTLSTPGVVFLLDVPRVGDPVRVFDQMRLAAKRMTQTLEGVLVDDNRRPLNDASLAAIREQVQVTAEALRAAHIDPGGPRAVRLFG
jgi:hypothetical protein